LGGELRLRASVIDEHGHAENFRRIEVRVAGPDGFSATVPLEAAGAGAYAGSLPLSRPGAYVATAVDEQTSEALGTTAAALSAGEELRPTGTDRGLLRQITVVTGGKVRDTLAGIFSDREALRFAYQNLNQLLTVLAASFLLLAVASRRLALPDFVTQATAALGSWTGRRKNRKASRARAAKHGAVQGLEALRQAKARSEAPPAPNAESAPRFASRPPPPPQPGQPTAPASTRPPGRQLTAAEILLARRRGKKP
jgi:Ca-activated chloride channel family protein